MTGIIFKINAGAPGKKGYGLKFKVGAGTYLIRSTALLQTTKEQPIISFEAHFSFYSNSYTSIATFE